MHKVLDLISMVMALAYNPRAQMVKAGKSGVQGHPWLIGSSWTKTLRERERQRDVGIHMHFQY